MTCPSKPATDAVGDQLLRGEISRPEPATPRSARIAQIVEAARRLLEGEGPDSLTMRKLAEELGMQAPSLYKHFPGKSGVELALIEDALSAIGEVSHQAIHQPGPEGRLMALLDAYRRHCVSHPNLYRLATGGPLLRDQLPPGLEEWAGNPWFVVTGDPSLAQALWSFAHGMVILELDDRYPADSDLDATWRSGAVAFDRAVRAG
jgi:AcrR family transcriptional regulator